MVSIIIIIAVSGLLLLGTYEFTKKILLQKKSNIQEDWFGVELNDSRGVENIDIEELEEGLEREVNKKIREMLGGF